MSASFIGLGVPQRMVEGLAQRGIDKPFPVQAATLPDALAGHDICGRAPTGSGKTLAFGLALALRLKRGKPGRPVGIVLVPTRELAAQVALEISLLCAGTDLRVAAVYGGAGYGPQVKAARAASIVVATPGRLEDLIDRRDLNLGDISIAVLDEADRMADMGFMPAVKRIMAMIPKNRQTMLFSATLDGDVNTVIRDYQRNPKRHEIAAKDGIADIDHLFWNVTRENRVEVVADIAVHFKRVILFCRTKHGSDRVARQLDGLGVRSCIIHGNRSQAQRERALQQFREGRASVMVATDVAARGIHIDAVPVVVHFDPPEDPKDYIHRSGRTGRAGLKGVVISLVDKSQRRAIGLLTKKMPFAVDITDPEMPEILSEKKVVRPGTVGAVQVLKLTDNEALTGH